MRGALTFANCIHLCLCEIVETPVCFINSNSEGSAVTPMVLFSKLSDGHAFFVIPNDIEKPCIDAQWRSEVSIYLQHTVKYPCCLLVAYRRQMNHETRGVDGGFMSHALFIGTQGEPRLSQSKTKVPVG